MNNSFVSSITDDFGILAIVNQKDGQGFWSVGVENRQHRTSNQRVPFQGLSKQEWLNLALLAVAVYYVVKPAMEVYFGSIYMFFGGDFLSFWSAGWLANQRSYTAAYDPLQLAEIQYLYIPKPEDVSNYQLLPIITFFPPLFLLLFQAFAHLPLTPSFILWSLVNFCGHIAYLIFFARSLALPLRRKNLLLGCLFWPFFQSIFWGQIGLILLIAVGEFFRAYLQSRPWRAGFGLAILTIKPQALILILGVLLIQRQWKTLIGFGITAAAIGLLSLALLDAQALKAMWQLADELAYGYPTIAPHGMMNWRMVGENFSSLGMSSIGWTLTWSGILFTLIFIAYPFLKIKISLQNSAAGFLSIFAATGLIAWHFHIHSAIILLPFLFYLIAQNRISESWMINWIVFPGAILFLTDVLSLIFERANLNLPISHVLILHGGTSLILSAITLIRATRLFKTLSASEAFLANPRSLFR